jgi:hypothetical protein
VGIDEGEAATEHCVQNNARAPHIRLARLTRGVNGACDDLGRDEVWRFLDGGKQLRSRVLDSERPRSAG